MNTLKRIIYLLIDMLDRQDHIKTATVDHRNNSDLLLYGIQMIRTRVTRPATPPKT